MATAPRTVLVTGGYGFIGTNYVRYHKARYPADEIVVLDSCTYAANPYYARRLGVNEERVDIRDQADVARVMQRHRPDLCIHFAAESHVCRSIAGPKRFMTTNIMGTFNLLEEWRVLWEGNNAKVFLHVSTDEVFGELAPMEPAFDEDSQIKPNSPYAASKAASDLIAIAYHHTYGTPVRVTNCSNNFGPHQHDEKLVPATIARLLEKKRPRVFGSGLQVRDWLYVGDHCSALDHVVRLGENGQRYCIGGERELTNLAMVRIIYDLMVSEGMIEGQEFGLDFDEAARPTDDRRYAIDNSKIRQLGWAPDARGLPEHMLRTIKWYAGRTRDSGQF